MDSAVDPSVAALNKSFPKPLIWMVATSYVVLGITIRIILKYQSRDEWPVSGSIDEFDSYNQPFVQSFIMFLGMSFCLATHMIDVRIAEGRGKPHGVFEFPLPGDHERKRAPGWWQLLPSFLDLGGTVCGNIALTLTYASTQAIFGQAELLFTAAIYIFLLRRPLRVHEILGIAIVTGGMVSAGISAITAPDESSVYDTSYAWVGIIISLAGVLAHASKVVVEEHLMIKAYTPPLFAVGWQGVLGCFMTVICIVIFHYAGTFDFTVGWYQMWTFTPIITTNFVYLVLVWLYNGIALMVTALTNSLFRIMVLGIRSPALFIIELIIGWQNFNWGSTIGLILTTIGFLTFNYLLGLSRKHTPTIHKAMRKPVYVGDFCKKLPSSDSDGEQDKNDII